MSSTCKLDHIFRGFTGVSLYGIKQDVYSKAFGSLNYFLIWFQVLLSLAPWEVFFIQIHTLLVKFQHWNYLETFLLNWFPKCLYKLMFVDKLLVEQDIAMMRVCLFLPSSVSNQTKHNWAEMFLEALLIQDKMLTASHNIFRE